MNKIRSWISEHQVLSFFLLAFAISWGTWIPLARLFYKQEVFLAGVPMSWGIFGPALAGILITRFIHPEREGESRRVGTLVFVLAWVLTAMIWIVFTLNQAGVARTRETTLILSVMGSLIALAPAYVIASAFGGRQQVRVYLRSLVKPGGAWTYYLLVLMLPPLLYGLGGQLSDKYGLTTYWRPPLLNSWIGIRTLTLAFFYQFCFANVLGEEVGWRGFALPRLQSHYSPLIASLIFAPIWFVWHLPLKMANPDPLPYLFYGLTFIPSTVLLTWIYNRTGGSILAVGIAHVSLNLAGKYLFPISHGMLILAFILVFTLILIDRMWKKLPANHPAVYSTAGMLIKEQPAIEIDRAVEIESVQG